MQIFTHLLRRNYYKYEAIEFAKEHVPITRKEVELIFHAGKSVLYYHGEPWVTKEGNFALEANDRANVCELIGIYMLYLIGKKYI